MPRPNVLRSGGFMAFLATQFLGAFNDNVFKLLISLFAVSRLAAEGRDTFYVTLAAGLFTAPFLIFSPYAGFLADRFSKKKIMVWVKAAEVLIMTAGVFAFLRGNLNLLLGILFLMGSQSAFFGPAKYGFLPEVLPDEQLSKGNGSVQMWTFLAIIIGGAVGGQLSDLFAGRLHLAALFCVGIAVAGVLTSFFITPTVNGRSNRRFEANSLRIVWQTLGEMRQNRLLFLSLLGTAYFWFLGALFQINLLFYGKSLLKASDSFVGMMQAAVALGMGVGSTLAGRWSGKKVEFGLVPIGACGVTVFCTLLAFTWSCAHATLLTVTLLGMSAGLFSIPMATFIQQQSPDDSKGRFLATNSVASFAAMTVSYPVLWLLRGPLGCHAGTVFLILGLVTGIVLLFILSAEPDIFIRSAIWICVRLLHKLRIEGQSHIPRTGGALIVCNHLSLMDGLLVKIAFQRPVRFLISRDFYEAWWLRPFVKSMQAIPIADTDGPKAIVRALSEAARRIEAGELVCIFPEGGITRIGNLQGFGRGIEHIMKHTRQPILPVCLDGLWGTFLSPSFEGHYRLRLPWPRARVTFLIGRPLPHNTPATAVRETITLLSAQAFLYRPAIRKPVTDLLPRCLEGTAGNRSLEDSETTIQRRDLFAEAIDLSREISMLTIEGEHVGIAGMNGIACLKAHLAVVLAGRASEPLAWDGTGKRPPGAPSVNISTGGLDRRGATPADHIIDATAVRKRRHLLDTANRLTRVAGRGCHGNGTPLQALCRLPNGTVFSHRQLIAHAIMLYQTLRFRSDDRLLILTDNLSEFGICCGIWFPLLSGLEVMWSRPDVLPGDPSALRVFAPRVGFCAVRDLAVLHDSWGVELPGSLELLVVDNVLPEQDLARFEAALGVSIMCGLTLPGLPAPVAVNSPDVVSGSGLQKGNRPGTAGRVLPYLGAQIVNAMTRQPVAAGKAGHLALRGILIAGAPDKSAAADSNWKLTEVPAAMDDAGFVTPLYIPASDAGPPAESADDRMPVQDSPAEAIE